MTASSRSSLVGSGAEEQGSGGPEIVKPDMSRSGRNSAGDFQAVLQVCLNTLCSLLPAPCPQAFPSVVLTDYETGDNTGLVSASPPTLPAPSPRWETSAACPAEWPRLWAPAPSQAWGRRRPPSRGIISGNACISRHVELVPAVWCLTPWRSGVTSWSRGSGPCSTRCSGSWTVTRWPH